jgi:hypothetical protein
VRERERERESERASERERVREREKREERKLVPVFLLMAYEIWRKFGFLSIWRGGGLRGRKSL